MGQGNENRAREALLRLLADASSSPQARVDALVALSQRTVWVATWEPKSPSLRTLEQDDGRTALPVFTDEWELDHAAAELEWNRPGVAVARKEIGAREALRRVLESNVDCLIVDLASGHCLEASRAEIEPLAKATARTESQGAFAAVGRITNTMLEAVRASQASIAPAAMPGSSAPSSFALAPTPLPTSAGTGHVSSRPPMPAIPPPPPLPKGSALPPPMAASALPPPMRTSTPPPPVAAVPLPDSTARLLPLTEEPVEAMLDSLIAQLRGYPEVEWAAYCNVSLSEGAEHPVIAIRVDPAYRHRANDLASMVAGTTQAFGPRLEMMMLDRPDLLKLARIEGLTFFPWKKKRTGGNLGPVG